jgi:hypothetical protein
VGIVQALRPMANEQSRIVGFIMSEIKPGRW